MRAQGNYKPRSSVGDLARDATWDSLAGEIARELAAESRRAASEVAVEPAFSIFGAGQSEAEQQLYAYLDRMNSPRSSGFPPLDALSARLGEFAPSMGDERPRNSATNPYRGDLDWFELKFEDLKRILRRSEEERSDIGSLNAKLAQIMERVDRLAEAMPKQQTLAAMETQLAAVSRSLETTREQSALDADRIARAAQEIFAATERAQLASAGFDKAARHTVKELGQTVVVAASQAACVTFEQFAETFHSTGGLQHGLGRVEGELRALGAQSRESGERTEAAIERVHETLRTYLERDRARAGPGSPPPRRRALLHMPISADAPAYSHPDSGFGSEPARKPQLDTITLRTPRPPDANFIEALRQAEQRLTAGKKSERDQANCQSGTQGPSAAPKSSAANEDEKALPLLGLSIVAIVLLLASAALYYLHTRPYLLPFHLTLLPQIGAASNPHATPTAAPRVTEANGVRRLPGEFPALLTATEQPVKAATPDADASAEDLQTLTSAASHGDREAQYRIGCRFLNDIALQDASKAARWFARAADQGHAESQFILASLYERGAGVAKDETHAIALYRKAAEAGHVRAMHNLGVLLSAHESQQDYREAAKWFAIAAAAGLPESQYNLALLYERGLGLKEDRKKACFWYQVAALSGDKEALQRSERLKGQMSQSDTESVTEQVGAWHPAARETPVLPPTSARG